MKTTEEYIQWQIRGGNGHPIGFENALSETGAIRKYRNKVCQQDTYFDQFYVIKKVENQTIFLKQGFIMNRYTPDIAWTKGYEDTPIATMFPDESGEYVRYEDIIRIINRMVCGVTGPNKPAN